MGTTVATNALLERKGEPHAAGHHARLSRRAAHRLPGPAAAVRPPHRAARAAVRAGGRGRRARRRATARCCSRSTQARAARELQAAFDDGFRAVRHRVHARLALHRRTSRRRRALARAVGFTQVSVSHEVSPLMKFVAARRHHGGRRLPVADPAPLRRPGGRASCRACALYLHAVERRPDRGAPLPGQGRHPVRPGRRHRRHGAHRAGGRASTSSSASTWAAPRTDVRTTPASSSAPSRRRWPACACARR